MDAMGVEAIGARPPRGLCEHLHILVEELGRQVAPVLPNDGLQFRVHAEPPELARVFQPFALSLPHVAIVVHRCEISIPVPRLRGLKSDSMKERSSWCYTRCSVLFSLTKSTNRRTGNVVPCQ
jgi:hypothetical protein